jgi:hypothetical protein
VGLVPRGGDHEQGGGDDDGGHDGEKYLNADEYNVAKNEGTAKALGFVAMLTPALQTEYETVEKMVKKDSNQSEADRAGEHNAAEACFTGEKKRVDDLVAASLAVMQTAKTVVDAEMKEADRIIDLEETARACLGSRNADGTKSLWAGSCWGCGAGRVE